MSGIPSTIGRYQVLSRIARGGMGTLYAGWDPKLDRQIAIKLLTDDDDQLRERFAREARSVARLHHPNIVTIFDVGEFEGQPFIAMEYVRGETLAAVIKNGTPLTIPRRLEIIEGLGDGLAYAHKIGIVHRDVKPANIMIEPNGSVKILDFGIARLGTSATVTVAGMLIGTLNYMSPEQAKGKQADNRSDLFAVGAVMYELLSYQQAFSGGFQDGVLHRVVSDQPEPLEKRCPGLDREVIAVVARALEKNPRDRYQELGPMVADIRRIRNRLSATPLPDMSAETVATPPPILDSSRRVAAADRESLARRRAQQIEEHLEHARRFFSAADYDAGIGACEQVLMIDGENATALEMLDQARLALDERQAEEWLSEATVEIERGALTAALAKIERASTLVPSSARAVELRKTAEEALAARERARQRAEQLRGLISRAGALFDQGQFSDAIAVADEALALENGDHDAQALKTRSLEAMRAQEREELNRRAREAVREARRLFAADDHAAALDLLARFDQPHDLIVQTLDQLKAESARIAQQRAIEAERRARRERVAAALASARAEIDEGRFAEAIAQLRALEKSDGGSPELAGLVREAEAGQQAQALAAKKAQEIAEHVSRAAGLLARDNLKGALERADAALALDPDHKAAQSLRSRIADRLRAAAERQEAEAARRRERDQRVQAAVAKARHTSSHAAAIDILREALELDPEHQDVKQLLGSRQAALEREEAERRRAQQAESARQDQIRQLIARAQQAFRGGDLEKARQEIDRAIALDPAHGDAQALLENIEVALEQRRVAQAEAASAAAARQRAALERTQLAADRPMPTVVADVSKAAPLPPQAQERRRAPGTIYWLAGGAAVAVALGIVAVRFARTGPSTESTPPITASPPPPTSSSASPASTSPAASAPVQPEAPTTTRPTEAAAPAAPAGSPAASDLAGLRRLAREQVTRGEREQALATIASGLKSRPGDAELKALLNTTLTDARARLRDAHQAASLVGDAATRSTSYSDALQREPEVARLVRAGRTEDALRSAWSAIDLFTRALEESRRAAISTPAETSAAVRGTTQPRPPDRSEAPETQTQAPPPAPTPPPAPAPSPVPAPVETAPPRPAPTVQTPPPPAPRPASPSDDQVIRAVVQAYADGYSQRDSGAVRRVFPSVNEQALRQNFSTMNSLQVQMLDQQINITGTTATVSCTWVSVAVPKVGSAQRASSKIVLRLQKSGETWVIVDRR